jgi:uncharacterized protein YndB with AHSA1/START domain
MSSVSRCATVVRQLICGTWSECGYLLKTFAWRAVRRVDPIRKRALGKRRLDALRTEAARGTRTKEHQMSGNERAGGRILGSLGSADGKGVVRMEDRFDTDIDDVWSALTDPSRLARWYGEVEGDLRAGGQFRVRVLASGWEGAGRVEACEPPRRLVVTGQEPDQPGGDVSEVTLAADGDQTILVLDQPGLPLDQLAAYGAATQVHVEDLAAHLAGRERCDAGARMDELLPAYQDLAANVG